MNGCKCVRPYAAGPLSRFTPYVNLLPAVHRGIPLFFGPAAVQALQYPPATEQLKRRSRFLMQFAAGPLAAATSARASHGHGGPFQGHTVDANALGQAPAPRGIISSTTASFGCFNHIHVPPHGNSHQMRPRGS